MKYYTYMLNRAIANAGGMTSRRTDAQRKAMFASMGRGARSSGGGPSGGPAGSPAGNAPAMPPAAQLNHIDSPIDVQQVGGRWTIPIPSGDDISRSIETAFNSPTIGLDGQPMQGLDIGMNIVRQLGAGGAGAGPANIITDSRGNRIQVPDPEAPRYNMGAAAGAAAYAASIAAHGGKQGTINNPNIPAVISEADLKSFLAKAKANGLIQIGSGLIDEWTGLPRGTEGSRVILGPGGVPQLAIDGNTQTGQQLMSTYNDSNERRRLQDQAALRINDQNRLDETRRNQQMRSAHADRMAVASSNSVLRAAILAKYGTANPQVPHHLQ